MGLYLNMKQLRYLKGLLFGAAILGAVIVAQGEEAQQGYYPGVLNIPVNKLGLKGDKLKAEELFAQSISEDPELYAQIYKLLPDSEHGKILDVDIVRHLFAPYNFDAYKYVQSTHKPASVFTDYLYATNIDRISKNDLDPNLIFMAGGGGSGKGVVKGLLPDLVNEGDLILDGTMANFEKTKDRIEYALDRAMNVTIIYVYRPIEKAVSGG